MKYKHCWETLDFSKNNIVGNRIILLEMLYLPNLKYLNLSGKNKLMDQLLNLKKRKKSSFKTRNFHYNVPRKLVSFIGANMAVHDTPLANIDFKNGTNLLKLDLSGTLFKNCAGFFKGLTNLEFFWNVPFQLQSFKSKTSFRFTKS